MWQTIFWRTLLCHHVFKATVQALSMGEMELHKSQWASVCSFHRLKLRGVIVPYQSLLAGEKIVGLQGVLVGFYSRLCCIHFTRASTLSTAYIYALFWYIAVYCIIMSKIRRRH